MSYIISKPLRPLRFLMVFFDIFFLSLFFTGVSIFWIGFHNFDLGHNINWVNAKYDLDIVDYHDYPKHITGYQAVNMGVDHLVIGFGLSVFSFGFIFSSFKERWQSYSTVKKKKTFPKWKKALNQKQG